MGRAVARLPEPLRRRVRNVVARLDNRAEERSLAREIAAQDPRSGPSEGLAVPPALLRVRVSGWRAEREAWLEAGATDARLIQELLSRHGVELADLERVLDFGCGCGRVARYWSSLDGPAIDGVDVSRSLVRWCRRQLPFVRAKRIRPEPPLPYGPNEFDFIYAISVLTHLSEQAGRAWLEELVRVLRPGGLLLFTVHGERFARVLSDADRERFRHGQVVITQPPGLAGTNRYGAFHPAESVVSGLLPAVGVELLEAVYEDPTGGRGVSPVPIQDNYLVRKPVG